MRGRPKLPETDRKSELIRIRVSADEKAALTAAAERAGYGEVSGWLREVGLRQAGATADASKTDDTDQTPENESEET